MKRTAKILALVLAALLALSGCGEKKTRAEIEKALDGFFESVFSLDTEEALAHIDPDSEYYKASTENGIFGLDPEKLDLSAMLGEEDRELLGDSAGDYLDSIIEMVGRGSKYTVNSVEAAKDRAEANVSVTLPNFDNLGAAQMSPEDIPFDIEDFLAYAKERGYDQDGFLSLDPADGQELIFGYMRDNGYMDAVINSVISNMEENLTYDTVDVKFTLRKIKGEWKISGEEQLEKEKSE